MQIRIFTYILICFLLASCAHLENSPSPSPSADYIAYLRHVHVLTMDRLHRIKIGKVDTVEDSMESDIAVDAQLLYQYLISTESKNITAEERKSIYQQLILLSVMNEKFNVKQWRQNEYLQEIFKEVQSFDKEFTSKFRCKDWENPWWSYQGCKE